MALIERIDGRKAVFYQSNLQHARIKYSDLSEANFSMADLNHIGLREVKLGNACFAGCTNLPREIAGISTQRAATPAPNRLRCMPPRESTAFSSACRGSSASRIRS